MSRITKILLTLFALSLLFFGLARLYFRLTDDFRIANMTYEIPHQSNWEIAPLTVEEKAELNTALDQPYTYIGKGAQVYAFASADDKYVLKFFKFKHLKPSFFIDWLPTIPPFEPYKSTQIKRKDRKLKSVFNGYKVAWERDRDNTGLIYIHLNKTNELNKKVTVKDKIGREHTIDLDDVVFVVQKKGKTLRTVMTELLSKGDVKQGIHRFEQIIDMYMDEYSKGIWDHDHGVMHNTGFIGDVPLHLDVGKFNYEEKLKDPTNYKPDLIWVAGKMDLWVKREYPNYHPEIRSALEHHLSEIFGQEFHFPQD